MKNKQIKQLNDLMNEWQQSIPKDESFSADGIVDLASWQQADKKILVLLKETNRYDKGGITDLIRQVVKKEIPTKEFWGAMTFHTVGKWLYGLENFKNGTYPKLSEAKKYRKQALLNCAYMNLKKATGSSSTRYKELENATKRDAEYIKKEIEIINPDIVICGGTYNLVKKHIFPELERVAPRIHKFNDTIFINSYHPAYRRIKGQVLYDMVLKSYADYINQNDKNQN